MNGTAWLAFVVSSRKITLRCRKVTFGHQSGARSRSKVLLKGSQIRVRYNEREGRFDATAVLDDQPMVKKDLNPNWFEFNSTL